MLHYYIIYEQSYNLRLGEKTMDIKNTLLKHSVIASSAIVLSLSMASTASAHNGKIAMDGSGRVLLDGSGRCVTAAHGNTFPGKCGDVITAKPIAKPAPVPVMAPKPKPVPVVVPKPAPKPVFITKTLSLNESGGANFAFDSDDLSVIGKGQLANFANSVKASSINPSSVSVIGHTDSIGPESYNQKLSERRANSVANYLAGHGMNRGTMQVSGRGETQPVASNKTKAGRAQNRRVDIRVTGQRKVRVRK